MTGNEYFSNGKLLLSGEFLVLEGATALAIPLKYGQHLEIKEGDDAKTLSWASTFQSEKWFDARYDLQEIKLIHASDPVRGKFIQQILINALRFNHQFIAKVEGMNVQSVLDFNPSWGWGSSSTLISNIAYWSETNPFDLFFATQEGSGYDIACARASSPILYQMNGNNPVIREVRLKDSITRNIYFVYLGHKQDTAEGIRSYRQSRVFNNADVENISQIAYELVKAHDLNDFNKLIREHERIMSRVIRIKPVKEVHFSNFEGEVKSLGTWGGDFMMMSYEGGKKRLSNYLRSKNLDTLFAFGEIAL